MRQRGFTLIELIIVVAIIAVIMAIVIPGLLRARVAANETSAIGTLKTTATTQEQFKTSAVVDTDGDGQGEYGFYVELAGAEPYRTAACGVSPNPLSPAMITGILGTTVVNLPGPDRYSSKSGYHFRMFLPREDGQINGVAEDVPVPCNVLWADNQETRWVCYAWPASLRVTGNKAFFINNQAEVYQTVNVNGQQYNGNINMPGMALGGNEALSPGPPPQINLDGFPPGAGAISQDGFPWTPAGN